MVRLDQELEFSRFFDKIVGSKTISKIKKGNLIKKSQLRKKFETIFFTGSRGEWGYIRPILEICKRRKIKFTHAQIICIC